MKQEINVCYIDDRLDSMLSRYIYNYCIKRNKSNGDNYELNYLEYEFQSTDNYKTLLSNDKVNKSNIIIIDSRLFENQRSHASKFTGEQFKIILRQILPFVKTIVISQNTSSADSLTIKKYQATGLEDTGARVQEYYDTNLATLLDSSILATVEEFDVLRQLENEDEIDDVLVATIQSTIVGLHDSALFEKEDLDKLVKLFTEVKTKYED